MKDVQNMYDSRNIEIDKVGVKNVKYPIVVLDKTQGSQHTIAELNMYVSLPRGYKGTHMSRFVEILHAHKEMINMKDFLRAGVVGFGIGGNLVDKEAVARGDFDEVEARSRAFVSAIQACVAAAD